MRRSIPYLLVTTAGAAVMVLELVGSRVLAPYFGATTIIWTALIGIILTSMALGYWWGGSLADRHPDYRYLSAILLGAATWIGGLAFAKEAVLAVVGANLIDLRLGASLAAILLFSVPSFLLASVGPFVIRTEMRDIARAGSTVGRLNAASTAGSIAGTFLAGFVLLAWVGHFQILVGLALLLIGVAALCYLHAPWHKLRAAGIVVGLAGCALPFLDAPGAPGLVEDLDSRYSRIQVRDHRDPDTGRPVRAVHTDVYGAQAGVFLDRDDDLVYPIHRSFRLVHHFATAPRSLLVIGGGVGVVPRDFLQRVPEGRVDMVEIDPLFLELGRRYFGLRPDPRLAAYSEDGRTFVRRSAERYDAIIVDAFSTPGSVPYQLTTSEFVAELFEHVEEEGVVLVNLASAIEGERGLFLQAEVATYARHFPRVAVFQLDPRIDSRFPQSLLLAASKGAGALRLKSDDPELDGYLKGHWRGAIERAPVLTDDHAPVDYYFSKAVF